METLPLTYALKEPADRARILNKLKTVTSFKLIAKGKQQKRKSIKVVDSSDILSLLNSDEYIVMQEIVPCCELIDAEIFNLRIYGLINLQAGQISAYVATQGKLIYSDNKTNPITSNAINQKQNHPGFTDELFTQYPQLDEALFWQKIANAFGLIVDSVRERILTRKTNVDERFTQLLGLEIILDRDGHPKILECNPGPGLAFNGLKDKELKDAAFHDWTRSFLLEKEQPILGWLQCHNPYPFSDLSAANSLPEFIR